MNYDKIRAFCKYFRIAAGLTLISTGIATGIYWFFLGLAPLFAGLLNFCPLCIITKKCTIK